MSEKGHEAARDDLLDCVRSEKGHSAVSGDAIVHMSRVKRITKLFEMICRRVSAVKRGTKPLRRSDLLANPW